MYMYIQYIHIYIYITTVHTVHRHYTNTIILYYNMQYYTLLYHTIRRRQIGGLTIHKL